MAVSCITAMRRLKSVGFNRLVSTTAFLAQNPFSRYVEGGAAADTPPVKHLLDYKCERSYYTLPTYECQKAWVLGLVIQFMYIVLSAIQN